MIKSLSEIKPDKILIRSTNWIGDAVMTTPAVRSIRENFPDSHIYVLVNPWVSDIFSNSPYVDEIIYYDKKEKHKGLTGMWRLARELGKKKFAMAILLQNAFEAALICKMAGIPVRVGYNRDCRGLLLTHPISVRKDIKKVHQVHYYQGILADLGLACGPDELFLNVADSDRQWAIDKLKTSEINGPIIGINPGAAYGPAKRWPAKKYGRLAAKLVAEEGAIIIVFGTEADREAAQTIKDCVAGQIINLCGKTTLSQAIAMIEKCDCFVTNDSGLMHVAAALKTPLAAIFGSTDHIATGPFSNNAVIIRKDIACSPCMKTHCSTGFECMMQISAEEVFNVIKHDIL